MAGKLYRKDRFPAVEWRYGRVIPRQLIINASEEIEVVFPDLYVDLCEKADGATPSPDSFLCGSTERVFGSLLAHDPDRGDRFLDYARNRAGTWPDGVVPFAAGPFGDFLCFDYRLDRTELQGIVYWAHEEAALERGGGITLIAASLEELISSLFDG